MERTGRTENSGDENSSVIIMEPIQIKIMRCCLRSQLGHKGLLYLFRYILLAVLRRSLLNSCNWPPENSSSTKPWGTAVLQLWSNSCLKMHWPVQRNLHTNDDFRDHFISFILQFSISFSQNDKWSLTVFFAFSSVSFGSLYLSKHKIVTG